MELVPRFKVLAFYNKYVEEAHLDFAKGTIKFFRDMTTGDGFVCDTTSNMDDMMGHGKRIFCDPIQNYLFFNALKWVVATDEGGESLVQSEV